MAEEIEAKNGNKMQLQNYKEKNGFNGIFIVESGKCQIINKVGKEKEEFT